MLPIANGEGKYEAREPARAVLLDTQMLLFL